MARIGFRPTSVADEPAISALLREAHGVSAAHPMFEPRHLYWKYWQPHAGWDGSRSYVLTRDDCIVAHAAVVPAMCTWGGGRLRLLHVIDWAARADARGAGTALMKCLGSLADAIVTSDGGEAALRLLPLMGFRQSHITVTGYVRPIRPLLYLSAGRAAPGRLLARCVRNALWALRAPGSEHGSRHARAVSAEDVGAASIPWPAPKYGTAVLERTAAVMSYLLNCPAVRMQLYVVEGAHAAEGYFVLAFAPGQARLVDCWLDCDASSGWEALVHLAVGQARRHQGVAEVAAICSEPLLAAALQHAGFHARYSRPLFVRTADGVRVPDAGMRVQMLDDDAAYLHSGSTLLWA
jgi:hypothetical protein